MAKYCTTDLQCKVMDECVQLHGGYGGTNEIMKEVIARAMGLPGR